MIEELERVRADPLFDIATVVGWLLHNIFQDFPVIYTYT